MQASSWKSLNGLLKAIIPAEGAITFAVFAMVLAPHNLLSIVLGAVIGAVAGFVAAEFLPEMAEQTFYGKNKFKLQS